MGACYPEYALSNTLTDDLFFKAKAGAFPEDEINSFKYAR